MLAVRATSLVQPLTGLRRVAALDLDRPPRPLAWPPSPVANLTAEQLHRRPPLGPIVARSFDWDDNVMFMPTEVVLFHKTTNEERRVDTGRWAEIREQVGVAGEWVDWEMRADDRLGSFRDAHDQWDPDVFVRDVERALAGPPAAWQGPRWTAFRDALSTAAGARQTSIITARGHEPASILAALSLLRARGLIAHLPPLENIFPVDNPALRAELEGTPGHPTVSKLKVMKHLLDTLQLQPFALHSRRLRKPSGDGRALLHLWHFSDDDPKTYRRALAELGAEIAAGRWSNVKVVLSYTGRPNAGLSAETVVLQHDGSPRQLRAGEMAEL